MDPFVEHVEEQLDGSRPHAGMSQGQGVGPYQEHRPHLSFGQFWPHADGMTAYQVDLQRFDFIGGDNFVFEAAKAGGDAIGDGAVGDQLLHGGVGFFDTGINGGV